MRFRMMLWRRLFLGGLFTILVVGCAGPAVMDSEESKRISEALFTAVTAKDLGLVDAVSKRLEQFRQEKKISTQVDQELTEIIDVARKGNWKKAAESLDWMIRHQP